jgi:hypothetical protein
LPIEVFDEMRQALNQIVPFADSAALSSKLVPDGDLKVYPGAELALFALIRQAHVLLDLRDAENDEQAWSDFRDLVFEDEDFLFLFNPELDGIEETEWARQHAVVGLKFSEWFRPFDAASHGAPHLIRPRLGNSSAPEQRLCFRSSSGDSRSVSRRRTPGGAET